MFITKILYVPCIIVFSLPLVAMEMSREVITGGTGFDNGRVSAFGRACVVAGLDQLHKVRQGDIVIASTTNKSWNKALQLSAGIITEEGGSNSHAVQLGKKFKIPVIVGVKGATQTIVDGSSISFDCAKTIVYELVNSTVALFKDSSIIPSHIFHGLQYDHLSEINYNDIAAEQVYCDHSSSAAKEKKHIFTKKVHKQHHHNFIDITQEGVRNDMVPIRENIATAKTNIGWAKYLPKYVVTRRITDTAYDCIPSEFCAVENAHYLEEAFNRLEDGVEYMQTTKEAFKEQILKNKTKIDDSEIAVFLYNKVVDHINAADELRIILKADPKKMDEYVRQGIVDKAQYMYYTLLNFTTRYYLEQELQKK